MIRTTIKCCVLALALTAGVAQAGPDEMRRAAEQGDAEMQLELGILYEYGYGLKQNRVPALAWYMVAAEQGNARAAQKRDVLRAHLSAAQVAEAERQAQALRAIIAKNRVTPAAAATTDTRPPPAAAPAPMPTAHDAQSKSDDAMQPQAPPAPAGDPTSPTAPLTSSPGTDTPAAAAPAQPAAPTAPASGPAANSP